MVDYREEKASSEDSQWTQSHLKILYPHPGGKEGYALAILTMEQSTFKTIHMKLENDQEGHVKNASPELSHPDFKNGPADIRREIWKWEFPREQLDLLVTDLSKSGFFEDQSRPNGESHLSVQIDKGQVSKKWIQEPRLEDFIKRIYEKGWLNSIETE